MSKKQQAQPKQTSGQQKRPSPQPNPAPPVATPAVETMSASQFNEVSDHAGIRPLRQVEIIQLQQQRGNRFVQSWLHGRTSDIQRICPPDCPPRQPERRVPGLADEVVLKVEDEIKAGNRQAAIDLVVDELASQGRLSKTDLDGNHMLYDGSMSDEGHTVQYWTKDPHRFSDAELLPTNVEIGPPAFSNVPWLYTAIIHEWRHVQQFRNPTSTPERDIATEVDAYLHGIEQAWASGLDTAQVLELWQRLNDDWWSSLTDPGVIANFQRRYDNAKAYVESFNMSGPAPRVFKLFHVAEIFFATGSSELDSMANDNVAYIIELVQNLLADHPDYDLRFTLIGHASPRWQHPRRGTMSEDLNLILSRERAETVELQLQNAFNADLGGGSCEFRVRSCLAPEMSVDEETWESSVSGQGSAKALAEGRGTTSDEQHDRRVDIKIEYSADPQVATQPPAMLGGVDSV